ncbi:MAG: glycosyltransferase family 117 protein, partial [Gemmatimonadaceae bacterium]
MPIRSVPKSDYKPSYLAASIASLLTFVLYLVTLAPSTAMWDTSEYIASAKVLGLPHPPGNPLFVLLGHFFGLLPIPVTYAQRINIMAALARAAAAGFWFLITERVLARWMDARWQQLTGAGAAVLIGATSFTVWNQSVVNEKVYTISLIGLAVISWLMVCWSDAPDDPRADRWLVLVAFLMGLGYTNHPAGFLPLPAVGIAVLVRRPQTLLRWRLILVALAALVLGLTPFAYEPIRAGYFPTINEGEPTGCTTHFEWSCTFSSLTEQRLADNINRKQYQKPSVLDRQAPLTAQVGMYWLYFKWQWLRDAYDQHHGIQNGLAALFLVLGLAGAWAHWKHDRESFWYFAVFALTVSLALVYYMNFKYSFSQSPQLGNSVPREPRDRDYFFLWSYSAWSVWVALGLMYVWESLATI